jgi:Icc-related predicted phosphoesterase
MKILTVSDKIEKSFFKEHLLKEMCRSIDLIFACGDLPPYYLEYLVNSLNTPLFYVPGNHDERSHQYKLMKKPFARGCKDIDQEIILIKGLLIGGLAGSLRYRRGEYLYIEAQMKRKIFSMIPGLLLNKIKFDRYIDILITHAPPYGIHDETDLSHRGFRTFLSFMKLFKPAYLIHGHTMPKKRKELSHYRSTTVINTNHYKILGILNDII